MCYGMAINVQGIGRYSMNIVTVREAKKCGFCVGKGVKNWCESKGLDYKEVVKNGIDADKFPNDFHIQRILEKRENSGR